MNYSILTVLILLTSSFSPTKAQDLKWIADRPLTWEDFQGKPDYKRGSVAVTVWRIGYQYHRKLNDSSSYLFKFKLDCIFDQKSSWRLRDYDNEYVLKHEQLHFDIAELHTRKLAAELYTTVFTANFKAQIASIYNKYIIECRKMQAKYDLEAKHSDNHNMQYRWALFIFNELKNLPRNY